MQGWATTRAAATGTTATTMDTTTGLQAGPQVSFFLAGPLPAALPSQLGIGAGLKASGYQACWCVSWQRGTDALAVCCRPAGVWLQAGMCHLPGPPLHQGLTQATSRGHQHPTVRLTVGAQHTLLPLIGGGTLVRSVLKQHVRGCAASMLNITRVCVCAGAGAPGHWQAPPPQYGAPPPWHGHYGGGAPPAWGGGYGDPNAGAYGGYYDPNAGYGAHDPNAGYGDPNAGYGDPNAGYGQYGASPPLPPGAPPPLPAGAPPPLPSDPAAAAAAAAGNPAAAAGGAAAAAAGYPPWQQQLGAPSPSGAAAPPPPAYGAPPPPQPPQQGQQLQQPGGGANPADEYEKFLQEVQSRG